MGDFVSAAAPAYDCLLVGAFKFPHGDAPSNRMLSLAKTFRAAGYRPLIVNDGPGPPGATITPGRLASCDGVDYISLPQRSGGRAARAVQRTARPLRISRAVHRLGLERRQLRWVCVVSGLYTMSMHAALRFRLGARILVDVHERHDVSQFPKRWRDPYFLRHRYTAWIATRLPAKVLVISEHLRDRFSQRKDTLVLPPAVDVDEYSARVPRNPQDPMRFLYAGSPGRKDLLVEILQGFTRLSAAEQRKVCVTIAGATRSQIEDYVGEEVLLRLGESVEVLGVIPRAQVHGLLAKADFALLIRPVAEFARAGFPSKVPESLAAGCPMILNYSSDLRHYVDDGQQVLVCRGSTAAHVTETIRRALALSDRELNSMSLTARSTARSRFDYRVWAAPLAEFLADD